MNQQKVAVTSSTKKKVAKIQVSYLFISADINVVSNCIVFSVSPLSEASMLSRRHLLETRSNSGSSLEDEELIPLRRSKRRTFREKAVLGQMFTKPYVAGRELRKWGYRCDGR